VMSESRVRYLEEWIEARLGEPIRLEDMAAAVNLTPRSVQSAFRLVRGCTPTQAIHRLRLLRVRHALSSGEPSLTVTDVAMTYGFFHLGRFACQYRERYGEKPSTTLARARDRVDEPQPVESARHLETKLRWNDREGALELTNGAS
jgi:transcriptional regulator GlxA family with amidase domain